MTLYSKMEGIPTTMTCLADWIGDDPASIMVKYLDLSEWMEGSTSLDLKRKICQYLVDPKPLPTSFKKDAIFNYYTARFEACRVRRDVEEAQSHLVFKEHQYSRILAHPDFIAKLEKRLQECRDTLTEAQQRLSEEERRRSSLSEAVLH